MNLTFMQFLPEVRARRRQGIHARRWGRQRFAQDYRTTFMNSALNFNMTLGLFPFSAYGGGIVVLPWEGATFKVSVIDPNGTPTNNDISEAFQDGVLVGGQGRVTIKPFGLVGHQLVGFIWSNKERLSLEQDPANLARLLLTERFPRRESRSDPRADPRALLSGAAGTGAAAQSREQYLGRLLQLRPVPLDPAGDPTRGIGAFFRFGVSDGVANPIKYAYNVGLGGKGIMPGRPHDTFGIGWARTQFSGNFAPFLRERLALGLDKEDVVEMYYNAAITGWLSASLDLQIIDPGLKKRLDSSNQLQDNNTAVVLGLRLYARF